LLGLLPDSIHIAREADQSAVLIRDIAQFLVVEHAAREPGAALMISRLIDILIIRCIRTWAKSLGPRQGWIGALADARVSKAVAAIHHDPARSWSVEALASVAGMSRSRFAERFLATVGEPPLRYLHRWRLAMAFDLLRRSNLPVAEVAHAIGYESEAAFSRAYKTMFGTTPRDGRVAASR
jgi:AraC-like DNA-binding protein